MYILVLIAFIIVFAVPPAMNGYLPPAMLIPAAVLYVMIVLLLGVIDSLLSVKKTADGESKPDRRGMIRIVVNLWMITGHTGLVLLGLRDVFNEIGALTAVPLAGDLMAMMPFCCAVAAYWLTEFPVYLHARDRLNSQLVSRGLPPAPAWGLGEYLIFNARHQVLFIVVPVCLITGLSQTAELYLCPLVTEGTPRETVAMLSSLASGGVVFVIAPLLIVRIWKTSPLPRGPLRTELEEMCLATDVRFLDILVWESSGAMANAGAMGIIPQVRYLLVSDAVLQRLGPLEIQAVFAHELGHVKNHHILYLLLFAISSLLLCAAGGYAVAVALYPLLGIDLSIEVMLLLIITVWFYGFGRISRAFEAQCDAFGAWMAGREPGDDGDRRRITPAGGRTFARALRDIVELNGMGLRSRNWRHGRAADRVRRVLGWARAGTSMEEIDRGIARIKAWLWIAAAAGILLTVLMELSV